jgi:adenylate kinase family enzyme
VSSDPEVPGGNGVMAPSRVWVVGTPGSGKSTLAGALAARTGAPQVQLDAVYWGPGGVPLKPQEFTDRLAELLAGDRWVVDGQYPAAVEGFVDRADCVVWVDPPLAVSWSRLLRRTVRRWIRREPLWGGTRETFWTVVGPHSILWYALQVHRSQRQADAELFDRLRDAGVRLVHVRGGDALSSAGFGGH